MNQSVTGKSSSLTSSAKSKIVAAVSQQPGRLGREIATTLGLEKSAVNSFLYGEGKRLHGLVESAYRWYPKSMLQRQKPAAADPAPRKASQQPAPRAASPTTQRWSTSSQDQEQPRTPLYIARDQLQNVPAQPHRSSAAPTIRGTDDAKRLTSSICGMLAQMNQTHAVLKIRQMPLNLIEVAFGEDDYPLLDDSLKIELVMRKKELESRPVETTVITKSSVNPWPWIMLALMGGFMLIQHLARHNAEPLVPQHKQVERHFKSSSSN